MIKNSQKAAHIEIEDSHPIIAELLVVQNMPKNRFLTKNTGQKRPVGGFDSFYVNIFLLSLYCSYIHIRFMTMVAIQKPLLTFISIALPVYILSVIADLK